MTNFTFIDRRWRQISSSAIVLNLPLVAVNQIAVINQSSAGRFKKQAAEIILDKIKRPKYLDEILVKYLDEPS